MEQEISLLDMKKNEVGRLVADSNGLGLSVVSSFSYLEQDLKRLLKVIKQVDEFTVRKSIEKGGAVLEVEEKVGIGHSAYLGAVADFINKNKVRSPRIFAVLRQTPGGKE